MILSECRLIYYDPVGGRQLVSISRPTEAIDRNREMRETIPSYIHYTLMR